MYRGKKDTKQVCRENIVKCNNARNTSPFAQRDLLEALGFMGEKSAVTEIIYGTYEFLPDCNTCVQSICREVCKIYTKVAQETIHSFVTRRQFQSCWRTANEDIQLSMEGIHFSHLKTAAWSNFLTNLYTAKLNACLASGVPLERWVKNLTVLPEKKFGSAFFDKLRVIILFEADFNWLQKIVFSKKIADLAKRMTWYLQNNAQLQAKTATKGYYSKSSTHTTYAPCTSRTPRSV